MRGGLFARGRGSPFSSAVAIEGVQPESRRPSMDQIKRASISSIAELSKHKKKKSMTSPLEPKNAWIELEVESPPLVFYGNKNDSTGTLFSGMLRFRVTDPSIRIEEWYAQIMLEYTAKRPIHKDCPDCKTKKDQLKRWEFFSEPVTLDQGSHQRPINHLIPGSLPATTQGTIGSITYHFYSTARTSNGEVLNYHRELQVDRALKPAEIPHHSLRVFPPTKLDMELSFPKIVHPMGDFELHLRLNHCTTMRDVNFTRWRVRKCRWTIHEDMSMLSPACERHPNKPGSETKSVLHNDSREIAGGEVPERMWKNDFFHEDGMTEVEFHAALGPPAMRPACDVDSGTGFTISHQLCVELVIQEEFATHRRPEQVVPTGSARVLKARYQLFVTERRGMGVAWDEEMPPVYEDVPPSPPTYQNAELLHWDVDTAPGFIEEIQQ